MSEQTRPTVRMRVEGVVFDVLFAKRIADRCTVTAGVALGWAREVVAALDREGLLRGEEANDERAD